MNKIYKSIWNFSLNAWVAVSEKDKAKNVVSSASGCFDRCITSPTVVAGAVRLAFGQGVTAAVIALMASSSAYAQSALSNGAMVVCGPSGQGYSIGYLGSGPAANCSTSGSVAFGFVNGANSTGGSSTTPTVGVIGFADGALSLFGQSIQLTGNISLAGTIDAKSNKITNLAAGTNLTDAVNFGQLTFLATQTAASLSSLSTGLSSTNSNVDSLSTSTASSVGSLSTGLSSTNSNVASLSTSTASSVGSLSTGLSSTN
ncbi:ESPR-type extended signal peptide-containing protein, partial [Burkholderia cenocepacia]